MHSDVAYRLQPHGFLDSLVPSRTIAPRDDPYAARPPTERHAIQHEFASFPVLLGRNQDIGTGQRSGLHKVPVLSCASQHHVAEHMLRRKTPNGTLAAGYDGRSAEWADRRPASKHFLTPLSTADEQFQPRADYRESRLPCSQDSVHYWDSQQRVQTVQDHLHEPRHGSENYASKDAGVPRYLRSRDNSLSTLGIDSVLYQGSPPHQAGRYDSSQYEPMVMQPMWPPCSGITSLNSPGPYGPYWPNGAFIPYRPAPMSDARFHALGDDFGNHDPMQNRHLNFSYFPGGTHTILPHVEVGSPARTRPWSPLVLDIQPSSDSASTKSAPQLSQDPRIHDGVPPGTYKQHHTGPAIESFFDGGKQSSCGLSGRLSLVSPNNRFCFSASPYYQGNQANGIQFKERVLMWAHRVYISLSSSKQPSRRLGPTVRSPNYQRLQDASCPQESDQSSSRPSNTSDTILASQCYPQSHHISSMYRHEQASSRGGAQSDLKSSHMYDTSRISESIYERDHRLYLADDNRSTSYEISNFLGGSADARVPTSIGMQTQNEPSPAAAAVTAIELLSRLCQESGWEWTDGMLLGGCLAYGLGDFGKAMKWYSKVLSCDPNNVEATSNTAATLLSLERRQEAEEYWLRSVRLRPSYFEAVEHLVGLYCENHRGKDAVQLIEFVERSLQEDTVNPAAIRFKHSASLTPVVLSSPNPKPPDCTASDTPWSEVRLQGRRHCDVKQSCNSVGYAIPSSDNGRLLSLIHGKGNMLYALGDNAGAARAFENAILIGSGLQHLGIRSLIAQILAVVAQQPDWDRKTSCNNNAADDPVLLWPEAALQTSSRVFPPHGNLPGLHDVPSSMARRAGVSVVSNSLLSLAKIYQDGMSSSGATATGPRATSGVQEILALYYLSLSLQPSPSTANNVGILLASIQQPATSKRMLNSRGSHVSDVPGVVPGSGIDLALAYYNYGLKLDPCHAHLYTNLGSLFKDIGQLSAAIKMYEKAVDCDGSFDIALANLANAVKDQGRISDAIDYYRRAVTANPDFAEAVCGLANALNSVCNWTGRGGVKSLGANRDRWHVGKEGMLYDGYTASLAGSGWIERVVAIVDKQLYDGEAWGKGVLHSIDLDSLLQQLRISCNRPSKQSQILAVVRNAVQEWSNEKWEGARVVRLIERATKRLAWQLYQNRYVLRRPSQTLDKSRPQLPATLAIPAAPTVLPFHTFTCPLSGKQIRKISQRNGLRISCSTLRAAWLPRQIYEPPSPPRPELNVGYVSSDFNNHPLAHLMQSVFGLHDPRRVKAFCYATTASDGSIHRQQIEREAPIFYDTSAWSVDRLVSQIVKDEVHILVNLNGYTRGAKNEVFAARPAPVQMSFMGFAGTLGAEWCDYLLADKIAIPPQTLRPYRQNVDLIDQITDKNNDDDNSQWVYGENVIFTRDTFFCCDHRQSAPDAREPQLVWAQEQKRRWKMRKDLFPNLPDDMIILGNFNQLYKSQIEPTTFRTWLRILSRTPKAILWLLRFPDLGEVNLRKTAMLWVGAEVASRIYFTDVAPKHQHISRARICDLFLDTPECNAHTTAADVLWSGTPLLTFPRYEYKMCSRMAASILSGALPKNPAGDRAREKLIVHSDEDYEEHAVELVTDLIYPVSGASVGIGRGRLVELRKLLYEARWTSALFDTRRWVSDLEVAYEKAWEKWVAGVSGDIWL
ncbi:MAG: hypothetical protein Q9218_000436 [Villophora microphyllina]